MIRLTLLLLVLATLAACKPTSTSAPPPYFGAEARSFLLDPVTIEVAPSLDRPTPDPVALDFLVMRARERCRGPVTLVVDSPAQLLQRRWKLVDVQNYERRTNAVVTGTHLYIAWLGGFYDDAGVEPGNSVIAENYGAHSIACFPDANPGNGMGKALVHEFGHVLNLVVNPSHFDAAHPRHDTDPNCVMYWTLDRGGTDWCQNCKDDLARLAAQPP